MRMARCLTLAASALLCAACHTATRADQARTAARHEIDRLTREYWDAYLAQHPTRATYIGDRRFDAELADLSEPAHRRWIEQLRVIADAIAEIDPASLYGQTYLTAAVLSDAIAVTLGSEVCARETWDVNQLDGLQVSLPRLGTYQPIDSPRAAADYVSRLSRIGAHVEQHIDNLERGLASGRTAPVVIVNRVVGQLEALLARDLMASPFVLAVEQATGLADDERARLRGDVLAVVEHGARPAWRRYSIFLRDTYLGAAREDVGLSSNPDGQACYAALIRTHTGSDMSPEEIHQLGINELEELHGQMNGIAVEQGFDDWQTYFARLQASPDQYLGTAAELLAHNEALVKRAEAALPQAFGRLPPIPVNVKALEDFRDRDGPAAYYHAASADGSRPAYFVVNTHEPRARPLFNMEALAFHEAVPGHHLQIAIAQSLSGLPELRRHLHTTAFTEGWALYAELLADELGLYSGPAARVGMLNYQAWRAARLVVDTGIHARGWSRARAVTFLQENVVLPHEEIENEIDRYIAWPGQALAYMIGRLEFQRLRRRAETTLSDDFDRRDFHDAVMVNGAVPLTVLRELVSDWLAAEVE